MTGRLPLLLHCFFAALFAFADILNVSYMTRWTFWLQGVTREFNPKELESPLKSHQGQCLQHGEQRSEQMLLELCVFKSSCEERGTQHSLL